MTDIICAGILPKKIVKEEVKTPSEQPKLESKKKVLKTLIKRKKGSTATKKLPVGIVEKELTLAKHTAYSAVVSAIGFGMSEWKMSDLSENLSGKYQLKVILEPINEQKEQNT